MAASEFTIRVLLLFFPGVICAYIVDTLTTHRPRPQFEFILNSVIYGLASYLLYWGVVQVAIGLGAGAEPLVFFRALTSADVPVSFRELAWASFSALVLALALTAISTYKVHFRLARKMHLTRKCSELDVWGFILNSPQAEWATVRDHVNGLTYDGWVELFSDDSRSAEIVLREVKVYRNDTGEYLYDVEVQYLSLNPGTISIEFRQLSEEVPRDVETQHSGRRSQEGRSEAGAENAETG